MKTTLFVSVILVALLSCRSENVATERPDSATTCSPAAARSVDEAGQTVAGQWRLVSTRTGASAPVTPATESVELSIDVVQRVTVVRQGVNVQRFRLLLDKPANALTFRVSARMPDTNSPYFPAEGTISVCPNQFIATGAGNGPIVVYERVR